ncbi:hypothetical protein [Saccharothrix sp. HUAS TT1]|uniref:hypothetical protein n=1 Tax=unclassified Saccharothrix TaxID=2593673 RepID=UPI00345BC1F3
MTGERWDRFFRVRPAVCLALVSTGFALDQLCGHLDRFRWPTAVPASVACVPLAVALRPNAAARTATAW